MKLNIISCYSLWTENEQESLRNGINLPASIPAYLALEKAGVPFIKVSDFLTRNDYHRVWKSSLITVWQMIQTSLKLEKRGTLNLIIVYSYSLYILIAQKMIFETFLAKYIYDKKIDEILIEHPEWQHDDNYVYYEGLFSPYYHEIAADFASRNGVKLTMLQAKGINNDNLFVKSTLINCRQKKSLLPAIVSRLHSCLGIYSKYMRNLKYILEGKRQIIFYLPYRASGLSMKSPVYTVNIEPFISGVLWLSGRLGRFKTVLFSPGYGSLRVFFKTVSAYSGAFNFTVKKRFFRNLRRNFAAGQCVFRCLKPLLVCMRKMEFETGCLSAAIYADWTYNAYVAEAFRAVGYKIGGVQHGGNTRLMKQCSTPSLLAEYGLADFFFQWGTGNSDEHVEYGIHYAPVFVATGSPRMCDLKRLGKMRTHREKLNGKPRILYAPTLLNVSTTLGNNVAWDHYIPIFKNVCSILDKSHFNVTVKILDTPEMSFFDFAQYSNIRFVRDGGFVDYMWDTDYIVVDSLGGSPVYESLITDKPILLYAGSENQIWDEMFIEKLKKRVVCFFDGKNYMKGLEEFVKNPDNYIKQSGVRITNGVVDEYLRPVDGIEFWQTMHNAFFSKNVING